MALIRPGCGNILITALLSSAVVCPASERGVFLAGISDISDNLQEITNILKGIHSFISSLSSIPILSVTIGFDTILLFLGIVVLSAGLSALGLPKGKFTFLTSLIIADGLWIVWKQSMNAGFPGYLGQILKSNLIVLSPFLLVSIIAALSPLVWARFKRTISALFRKKTAFSKKGLAELHEEYQARSGAFNRNLMSDTLSADTSEKITLSPETMKSIDELRSTLDRFTI